MNITDEILEAVQWCGPDKEVGIASTTFIFGFDLEKARRDIDKILSKYEIKERLPETTKLDGPDGARS